MVHQRFVPSKSSRRSSSRYACARGERNAWTRRNRAQLGKRASAEFRNAGWIWGGRLWTSENARATTWEGSVDVFEAVRRDARAFARVAATRGPPRRVLRLTRNAFSCSTGHFREWETHLLVGAVEPADAEVHDARLELGAVARERWRASHGAAHRGSAEGACVCVAQCIRRGRFYVVRRGGEVRLTRFGVGVETRKRVDNFGPSQTESP